MNDAPPNQSPSATAITPSAAAIARRRRSPRDAAPATGRRAKWVIWPLLLCALIASCDKQEQAKPTRDAATQPATSTLRKATPSVEHVVEPGQTLWDIAQAYDVNVRAIMKANRLSPRDVRRLKAGSRLRIPGARQAVDVPTAEERAQAREDAIKALKPVADGAYHHMGEGETLWDIARMYDVPLDQILTRNELDEEAVRRVRPGTPVLIPGLKDKDIKKAKKAAAPRKARGVRHTLTTGETIWDLARLFNVSAAEIMAANRLSKEEVTRLREGTKVFIPGVTRDRRGKVTRRRSASERRAANVARRLGLGGRKVGLLLLRGKVRPAWIRAAGGRNNHTPGTLRWPVANGWYVRGYGSGEGGYHLAVDIMGEIGWNVRSAAPGIVAYSGDKLRGYGNAVLVVHPGGWVTMYAHNSVNFAVAGQKVRRGEILAEVGSTGISRGPHVHFEMIHAGRNCDPAALFRPAIRHRNSKRSKVRQLSWTKADARPKAVRCGRRRRHPRSRWVIHEDPEKDAHKEPATQPIPGPE